MDFSDFDAARSTYVNVGWFIHPTVSGWIHWFIDS